MGKILVAGQIYLDSSLLVDRFPIPYVPVNYAKFGMNIDLGGSAFFTAKALSSLGDNIDLLSVISNDYLGKVIRERLKYDLIYDKYLVNILKQTPTSLNMIDKIGNRQTYYDMKDVDDINYPIEYYEMAIKECSIAILENTKFCAPFLERSKRHKKMIFTNFLTFSEREEEKNALFFENSNVVFILGKLLSGKIEDWIDKVLNKYNVDIIIVDMEEKGAYLAVKKDNFVERFPFVKVRDIVDNIGSNEALLSCFTHYYNRYLDPCDAIKKAILFASYQRGEYGSTMGFLGERELNNLYATIYQQ
ncbi:MAG TPA: carbohydrate kinase family protein [Spirochaetota bacterium]|nr:MAG: pfkB family carbohydrate kinase [Spirochaetes bacterium ADurb.Bin133]HNZ26179.1 carbohydrate kinase family protein [Spirochaetota bacterium]HPY88329.1 carbohydrate kinase family protein [Spirochaetota bacterium]